MGRMLESLLKSQGPRGAGRPSITPAPTEECVVDWSLAEEEIPYIEVGAPGKKVELSPGLVKHPAQPKVQPPHAAVEVAAPRAAVTVAMTEARPMAVAFEPWPQGPAPLAVAPEIVAYHDPKNAVSQAYASLLEKMLQSLSTSAGRLVQLAGVRPRAGATTVLLNLAVTAARSGKLRVIAVDANLAAPALATRLGLTTTAGTADVLAGRLALEAALIKTPLPNLLVLPAGTPTKATLTPEAAAWMLAWLRDRADLVLMDGPTLQDATSLATLVPWCDGLYLVLPQGETVDRGLTQSIAQLGGRLRGLIHTQFEM